MIRILRRKVEEFVYDNIPKDWYMFNLTYGHEGKSLIKYYQLNLLIDKKDNATCVVPGI